MTNEKIKDIEIPKFSKFVSNNEFTNKCIGLLKITTGNSKSNVKIIVNYFDNATTKLFIKKQSNKNDPAPDTSIFLGLYDKLYKDYTVYGSGTNDIYELDIQMPDIYFSFDELNSLNLTLRDLELLESFIKV